MTESARSIVKGWTAAQIYSLGLLVLLNLYNYLDARIIGILQQPMKSELRLEHWQLGIISGPAFALFYAFAGLPVALLFDAVLMFEY